METIPARHPAIEEHPLTPAVEDRGGVLSHMREMVSDVWEVATRNPREKLAIVAASIVCNQAAELTLNPEPARGAENIPAKASEASVASQTCDINQVVARPKIMNAEIRHAGKLNEQHAYATVIDNKFPDTGCENVERVESYKYRALNVVRKGGHKVKRWVSFVPIFFSFSVEDSSNSGGKYVPNMLSSQDRALIKCGGDGDGVETKRAEVNIKVVAKDKQTRENLAKRVYRKTISKAKVWPKRCMK